jgi:hypothetical protein
VCWVLAKAYIDLDFKFHQCASSIRIERSFIVEPLENEGDGRHLKNSVFLRVNARTRRWRSCKAC